MRQNTHNHAIRDKRGWGCGVRGPARFEIKTRDGARNEYTEREEGKEFINLTSSYASRNAVCSSDSPLSFLPFGRNHRSRLSVTRTTFPVAGCMMTTPAPKIKSVAWKMLSGIAGVDLSDSWWIDGGSWDVTISKSSQEIYIPA